MITNKMRIFKSLVVATALALCSESALAAHNYAGYECVSGNLELKYDGPGSNYAVGGAANFYTPNNTSGTLALGILYGDEKIGDVFAGLKLEVLFTIEAVVNGPVHTTPADSADGYDESEWESVRYIRINDISSQARLQLNLEKGNLVKFSCHEYQSVPAL